MPVPGSPRSTQVVGGSCLAVRHGPGLRAWLYDVALNGTSRPTWTDRPAKIVPSTATLYVSIEAVRDTRPVGTCRCPPRPEWPPNQSRSAPTRTPATGRSATADGRTNTLRVQPYGLRSVPLRPERDDGDARTDVAVWIPIVPSKGSPDARAESFRLLILHAPELRRGPGPTLNITETRIRALTPEMREAVITFFGEYLSWPPLPTPHARKENEVKEIAERCGLSPEKAQKWARNRNDVLAGPDGLFSQSARWYQPLGGAARSAGNYLPVFQRLIELGAVTAPMVRRWAMNQKVELSDYGRECAGLGPVTQCQPAGPRAISTIGECGVTVPTRAQLGRHLSAMARTSCEEERWS